MDSADGRVVRLDPDGLRAVDGRSGAVVWTTPFEQTGHGSLVTDGRVVVAGTAGEGGARTITAFGLDDGRPRWSTELGPDVHLLHVADRRLYGYTSGGLVVLGDA